METYTSPFFAEDIGESNSEYWTARRKVAAAMRELIEASVISDIPIADADQLATDLKSLSAGLRQHAQLKGVIAYAEAHGGFPVANHEILCVGGESHPIAPGLKHWSEGDKVRGSVEFDLAYEGPPGHVHGGWVAAIFDHFMGMAHMRCGQPGMTGGLSIRYLSPTPINQLLDLEAELEPLDERKTRVTATMGAGSNLTATAEAIFIRPRGDIFTQTRD